jgi:hypothetical protein
MTADLPVRPEITPGYRREADREIRAFTRDWTARDDRIASLSYFGTFAAYFFTLWLAVQAWPVWWLVVPLIVVNAFAGVRLYVLQHDCGHGSLYSSKRANDLAGHGLSVFTLTPYRVMQFNHNEHHSHLGNLEERDTTEIFTMTLREWEEADWWTRLKYRLYRNPLLMIPVGGLLTYVFVYRWPKNAGRIDAAGVILHNMGLALWIGRSGGWPVSGPRSSTPARSSPRAASASSSSTCSTISRTPGGTANPTSTRRARRCRGRRRSISAGGGISGPETSPITTSTISTPISPPTGCANATGRCARNTRSDHPLARGDPLLHAEALGRGSGTSRPLPARAAHRPASEQRLKVNVRPAPSSWPKNSRAERSRPRPQGSAPDGLAHHVPIGRLHRPRSSRPPSRYQVVTPVSIAISAMVASLVSGTAKSPAACPAFSTASSRSS